MTATWLTPTESRDLLAGCELLYWLLANNPPFRGPLYWTQDQWDECNAIREAIKSIAYRKARRERSR
jgi:hypothetical protein